MLDPKNTNIPPVYYLNGVSFFSIAQKDLYVIATTKNNENPSLVFEFLYSFLEICKSYFKGELSDQLIRQNYVLIYELLDEAMDFGVPQITETEILKQYIVEGGMDLQTLSDIDKLS